MSEHDTTAPALPVDAGEGRVPDEPDADRIGCEVQWIKNLNDQDAAISASEVEFFKELKRRDAAAPQPPGVSLAPDALAALLNVAKQWAVGPRHSYRDAADRVQLLADTRAAIAQAETVKAGASEPSSGTERQAVGSRKTFVVPPGYEAIRDADNRATGELRLVAPSPDTSRQAVEAMREGCCSAISPCPHQQRSPSTICDVCQQAAATAQHQSPGQTIGGK